MNMAMYKRAEASQLSKRQISSLAESIAMQLDYEPSGDIASAIKKLGGKIKVEDTLLQNPEQSGSLFVDDLDDFTIVVPSHTSTTRDLFTVAHELGHFIVHYAWKCKKDNLEPFKMMALRKDSDRVEWEANWFAAAFLMPSAKFKEKYLEYGQSIDAVAADFCVSPAAAAIRAKNLGLTN